MNSEIYFFLVKLTYTIGHEQLTSVPSKPEAEIMQQSRRTFLLRADEIRSLKQHILEQRSSSSSSSAVSGGEPSSKPPSTYVAISSLAWASVVRATPSVHDADEVHFLVSADCRNRRRPPLGDAFFGNCIKPCFARASAGDLRAAEGEGEGGVARAAAVIQDAIRAGLEELGDDPLSDAESWMASLGAIPPERLLGLASSHRFMAYETDFGWGAPTRVELAPVFIRRNVALLGAKDGAVQVSVAFDGTTAMETCVAFDGTTAMETFAASFVVPPSLHGQ
jgi:hypothetical protein